MIYQEYTIGGELMHSAKGNEWTKHKYVEKKKSKNTGKWYYIYDKIDKNDRGTRLAKNKMAYNANRSMNGDGRPYLFLTKHAGNSEEAYEKDYKRGGVEYANLRSKASVYNDKREAKRWDVNYHEKEAKRVADNPNLKSYRDEQEQKALEAQKSETISERRRAEAEARAQRILDEMDTKKKKKKK